jgi:hypothetical protein
VWSGEEVLIWPIEGGNAGAAYRPYWLVIRAAAEVYTLDQEFARMARPGERYRVVELWPGRARAQADDEPPSAQVWIQLDDRVQLSAPFP